MGKINLYAISSLVACLFCLGLGVFVFLKKHKDKKCRDFSVSAILTGLWTSLPFILSNVPDDTAALFWARLIYMSAIFCPPAWLNFILSLTGKDRIEGKRAVLSGYFFSALILPIVFSPLFIRGTNRFAPHFSVIAGPLYTLFVIDFTLIFILIVKNILQGLKAAYGYHRNQLKFVVFAFFFASSSAFLHFSAVYLNVEPFPHDILLVIYVGLVAYAIVKHRLMDIIPTLTRTTIFILVYGLVLGIPFLSVSWHRSWFESILNQRWWMGPLILMALLATAGQFVSIYLQKRAEAILLRGQRRYQEVLKQAARELARIHNLKKLLNLITHIVTRTVGITHSAMYLYDESRNAFCLRAGRNLKKQAGLVEKEGPLSRWFESQREALVYEEIYHDYDAQEGPGLIYKELERQMASLNAAVIVPGFLKEKLLGFLVLGHKRSGRIYTREDLDTFSVLANQAVLAIENAILYENIEEQVHQRTEELVKVQNQLIQAEKLATMGTLAGGVAHEINNPLTAILTNVQMLIALNNSLDTDTKESLELIEEATQRCRTIVKKLMAYARKPLEASEMSKVNLRAALEDVLALLAYQLELDNIKISAESRKDNFWVMGNENEIEQVITNIILNAKDAIKQLKERGEIKISLSENCEWLKVNISDDGMGMPQEVLAKVFDPFFTTKDIGKGLGLGLSICQAIIERHSGSISVKSELGKGSVFTIKLPKLKAQGALFKTC